jgi:hypothetical protein
MREKQEIWVPEGAWEMREKQEILVPEGARWWK